MNLNTKNNRKIPKINYKLFYKCIEDFPDINLIPNGEINNIETINEFSSNAVNEVMIGRKFAEEPLFLHNYGILKIDEIDERILNYLYFILQYPMVKKNLIQKSLMSLFANLKDSKEYKKIIHNVKSIDEIFTIFENRRIIWR